MPQAKHVLEHISPIRTVPRADGSAAWRSIMSKELVKNAWGSIFQHEAVLELRWLPATGQMTDGGVMATLCLLAWEAERARPAGLLVDAVEFHHGFGPALMQWRDAQVVPRYGAAGVLKFAFVMPARFPKAGTEETEGAAVFKTRWFTDRDEAMAWLRTRE
jgi:hypothetical protein